MSEVFINDVAESLEVFERYVQYFKTNFAEKLRSIANDAFNCNPGCTYDCTVDGDEPEDMVECIEKHCECTESLLEFD